GGRRSGGGSGGVHRRGRAARVQPAPGVRGLLPAAGAAGAPARILAAAAGVRGRKQRWTTRSAGDGERGRRERGGRGAAGDAAVRGSGQTAPRPRRRSAAPRGGGRSRGRRGPRGPRLRTAPTPPPGTPRTRRGSARPRSARRGRGCERARTPSAP